MNFLETVKGSMLENFYPSGWDFNKIDECCRHPAKDIDIRQPDWNEKFAIVECSSIEEFNVMLGHEVALEILKARNEGRKLILILPVGPMGMYRWIVYFLKEWNVKCDHVYGFNMDEWADEEGEAHITEEEFYSLLVPEGIDMRSTGRYIVYYTDGGAFGGHSVEVSGNSKGPTKAQITG